MKGRITARGQLFFNFLEPRSTVGFFFDGQNPKHGTAHSPAFFGLVRLRRFARRIAIVPELLETGAHGENKPFGHLVFVQSATGTCSALLRSSGAFTRLSCELRRRVRVDKNGSEKNSADCLQENLYGGLSWTRLTGGAAICVFSRSHNLGGAVQPGNKLKARKTRGRCACYTDVKSSVPPR